MTCSCHHARRLLTVGILLWFVSPAVGKHAAKPAQGDHRSDTVSPSGQFRVTMRWHERSAPSEFISRADYTIVCTDTRTKRLLWTHQYKDSAGPTPDDAFVSDDGWTVLRFQGSVLTPVDRMGHDHGQIKVLEQFSKSENEKYVRDAMDAPPQWAGESLWYFLDAGGRQRFVVRPWWGHRIVVDLVAGKAVPTSPALDAAMDQHEHAEVMAELAKGAAAFKTWENDCCPPEAVPVCTAAYLAGVLRINEAAPLLRRLEISTYSSSAGGVPSLGESAHHHDGEINPAETSEFTLRQFAQLSLRRLGQVPDPLPGLALQHKFTDYKRNNFFAPAAPSVPRIKNAGHIEKGMSAEQVVALIGGPDLINYLTWEYDLDTQPAKTLLITWKDYRIESFKFEQPAVWQQSGKREQEVCY